MLVAEDNPVNRQLVTTLLKKRGHSVRAVGDGRAAVDADKAALYDTIVMDVQMPIMGGLEATAAIRARERTSGRRVADRRAHRTRHAGRPRALPAGRHGRVPHETD